MDGTNLNFETGRYACSGRFFAYMKLKLLFANLLLKYDFKFPPGKGKLSLLVLDEVVAPNLWTKIVVRKRL